MTVSLVAIELPTAEKISVTEDFLNPELSDGRALSVPLAWFPRLAAATRPERDDWRLIGRGHGVHWPALDEDISVEGLLAGKRSGESQQSLRTWLASHQGT